MRIFFSSKFKRYYKKLSQELKKQAKEKEKIFRKNPFNPGLKTHKLHGKYKDYWSFSISGSYRIMFDFISEKEIVFIDVGDHDIYN